NRGLGKRDCTCQLHRFRALSRARGVASRRVHEGAARRTGRQGLPLHTRHRDHRRVEPLREGAREGTDRRLATSGGFEAEGGAQYSLCLGELNRKDGIKSNFCIVRDSCKHGLLTAWPASSLVTAVETRSQPQDAFTIDSLRNSAAKTFSWT